jgi:hypothetical protein
MGMFVVASSIQTHRNKPSQAKPRLSQSFPASEKTKFKPQNKKQPQNKHITRGEGGRSRERGVEEKRERLHIAYFSRQKHAEKTAITHNQPNQHTSKKPIQRQSQRDFNKMSIPYIKLKMSGVTVVAYFVEPLSFLGSTWMVKLAFGSSPFNSFSKWSVRSWASLTLREPSTER